MRKIIIIIVCFGFIMLGFVKKNQNKVLSCVITNDVIECLVLPQDIIHLKHEQIVYIQVENTTYQALIKSISIEPIVDPIIVYPVIIKTQNYQSVFQQFPIKVIYYNHTTNWLFYLLSKII